MLLRIEDTDRERSTEGGVEAIFDGLKLAGARLGRRAVHAVLARRAPRRGRRELLAAARPTICYCSPDELAEMREAARAAKGRPAL
jgi:glutamyl-tRNA synthetase